MLSNYRNAALVIIGLSLAACGGGGDGGAPPIQVGAPGGSAPPPTSTPPPPTIVYPKAPSAVVGPTDFTLLDTIFSSSKGTKIPASDLSLRWLGQPATYGLKIANVGEGELRQNSATDPAAQLVGAGGQVLMTNVDVVPPRGRYSGILNRYGDPFFSVAFGVATPAAGVPTTGVRAYRNIAGDVGLEFKIDVDFATRQVTGSIPIAWEDAWGPYPPALYALTPVTLAPGATQFTITFTVPGAPEQGQIVARFAGPNAEELMLSWKGQVKSPYDDSWVTQGWAKILAST